MTDPNSSMMVYKGRELGERIEFALNLAGLSVGQAALLLGVCDVRFLWLARGEVSDAAKHKAQMLAAMGRAKGLAEGDCIKLASCFEVLNDPDERDHA
jgi:predicted XRE-type DNA-binding protein